MSAPAFSGVVYVIDDDASVRRALGRPLRVSGCEVALCESAAEFLSLRRVARPCCLVVDVRMLGLTAFDLQEALNAEERHLPIVFITGHGDANMAARHGRRPRRFSPSRSTTTHCSRPCGPA